MSVPKIINFIWAGKPLPEDSHKIIEGWRTENPDFQAILWVPQPLPKAVEDVYISRGYEFASCGQKDSKDSKSIENIIDEVIVNPNTQKGPIIVADINVLFDKATAYLSKEKLDKLKAIIYYEMNKFIPNYGPWGDLVRYLVSLVFGGVYSDSDVECLGVLNQELPYGLFDCH